MASIIVALARLETQGSMDRVLDRLRHLGTDGAQRRQRLAADTRWRGLWHASGEQMVQRGAQGVEVRARLGAGAVLFDRRVAVGAELRRIARAGGMQPAGDTAC